MSLQHFLLCDACGDETQAFWNGDHWLPPKTWAIVCDHEFGVSDIHMHLCTNCVVKLSEGKFNGSDKKEDGAPAS